MTNPERLPVFEKFIQEMRAAWAGLADTEARMKIAAPVWNQLSHHAAVRIRRQICQS